MDDADKLDLIINDCRKGRQEGFERIVGIYSGRLYGYFYRLTGSTDTSNELLSEVFLRLIEKIGSYREGNFDFWLFKIAANIFYDHLRHQQRQKKLIEGHKKALAEEATGDKRTDVAAADLLQERLEQLDEQTRELILLRYYSDLSFKEIAVLKKEPLGTVLSKVHRGLAKLRQLMENNQYE